MFVLVSVALLVSEFVRLGGTLKLDVVVIGHWLWSTVVIVVLVSSIADSVVPLSLVLRLLCSTVVLF